MRFIVFMWIVNMVLAVDRVLWRLRLVMTTVYFAITTPFLLKWYRWRIRVEEKRNRGFDW